MKITKEEMEQALRYIERVMEVTKTKQKMVKVKIIGCSVLGYGSNNYVRGDVLEIPESMFEADLYEMVEPKPKVVVNISPKPVTVVEEVATEEQATEEETAKPPKEEIKKRKRKS